MFTTLVQSLALSFHLYHYGQMLGLSFHIHKLISGAFQHDYGLILGIVLSNYWVIFSAVSQISSAICGNSVLNTQTNYRLALMWHCALLDIRPQ